MSDRALDALVWQFDLAWRLGAEHILPGLTDEMCLWAPAPGAWTVRQVGDEWVADWADVEPVPAPATSIAWIAWQMTWWWDETLAHATGRTPPGRAAARYPGSAEGVRARLGELAGAWRAVLEGLDAEDLARPQVFPWAEPRPFATTVAWLNAELVKNLAEIGALRRIYESRNLK